MTKYKLENLIRVTYLRVLGTLFVVPVYHSMYRSMRASISFGMVLLNYDNLRSRYDTASYAFGIPNNK